MGTVTELQQIVPEVSQDKAINWLIEKIEDDLLAMANEPAATKDLLVGAAAMRGEIIKASLLALYRDKSDSSGDGMNN